MRLAIPVLIVLGVLCGAPPASAVVVDGDWYTHSAADSRRPRLDLIVAPGRATLGTLAGLRCLPRRLSVPRNEFKVRDGRFAATIRLAPGGTARERILLRGRWTSPHTVKGRIRVVVRRRARYCDSRWRPWRAGLVGSFGVRTSAPSTFVVPGSVATSVTVFNDGDYDSRDTEVTVMRHIAAGDPTPPDPVVRTSQGTCRWPVAADWADWTDLDFERAVHCRLGTVPAKSSAEITITETWTVDACASVDGSVRSYWDPAIRSPLLPEDDWQMHGAGLGSRGECPTGDGTGTGP